MKIEDMITRTMPPEPWTEGEKIPWDEPGFSQRMLKEHLSQDHDMASRRGMMIDRHVSWIQKTCLHGRPSRILDLACGPGLYSQRLAQLGHTCVGIDFSPASITYAQSQAAQANLTIDYVCADIRTVEYGEGFDLAMLLFGEFNVFTKDDARQLLACINRALNSGGYVLLEPHTYDIIQKEGNGPACWHTEDSGLFSANPHLWLEEHFWHAERHAATTRYFIIDAATGAVDRHVATSQAYTDGDYDQLLTNAGFSKVRRLPSLAGTERHQQPGLFVLMAKKA